jgi:hypothetical protein
MFPVLITLSFVLLSGCVENEYGKSSSSIPDAKEILTLNPKADIFMGGRIIAIQ